MRSRLLATALVLFIAALSLPAQADYVTGLNPRGDNFLALRTGPGTGYRTILRMGPDTVVTVLERRGDWLRVELEDGTRGWAFGDYIEPGFPPGYDEGFDEDFGPGEDGPDEEEDSGEDADLGPADDEAPVEDEAAGLDLDALGAAAEGRWTSYANARFGTAIDYPSGLYSALPPPDNDDGRSFASPAGLGGYIVFGSHNVFDMTLAELMVDDEAGGGYDAVTYRRNGEDWYVLSGYKGGDVFYRKVMLSDGGSVIHTFEITYPRAAKSVLDPVAARMGKSMRTGSGEASESAQSEDEPEPLADGFQQPPSAESGPPAVEETEAQAPAGVALDAWRAPLEELLFEGAETPLLIPHQANGGVFTQHARYEDGALVVDVPAGNGWGKAGLLSNDPLVWLDDFRDDAEVRVTFTLDPARTTGFGLALAQPGWGGVGGNDPGYPGMRFYWLRAVDGATARAELHVDPHAETDFWSDAAPAEAPAEVTFVLRPGRVAIEVDGVVVAGRAAPALIDGAGLRIYAFSHSAEVQGPARMALAAVGVRRTYPTQPAASGPAPGVAPLPVATIFAGEPAAAFEPAATAGGNFEAFARYADGALVVDVPPGHSWGKTGLISAAPLAVLDERIHTTPTRFTLTLDPRRSSAFTLAFSSAKAAEMWLAHDAWFSFVKLPDEPYYAIGIHQSAYRQWTRRIPVEWIETHWDGTLEYDLGDNLACMRIPGGPQLCAEIALSAGQKLFATLLANGPVADAPATMALMRITQGLVTPPGMTAGERWSLVPTDEFDPGQFLDELGSLLQ